MTKTGRMQIAVVAVCIATGCVVNPSMAGPRVNPGEWKYTMKTKIEGLGIPLPAIPVSYRDCVTKSDASPVETPEMKKAGCKIVDPKTRGDTITYTGHCVTSDNIIDTHYKLTFQADSMEGAFDQVRTVGGKIRSTATGTLTGKRIGACEAK